MKIDFDELKRQLSLFLESPGAFITLDDLGYDTAEGECEQKLFFHTFLLVENGLISDSKLRTGDPAYVGFVYSMSKIGYRNVKIRLTQEGHDFAKALYERPVLDRIKKELADAPFDLVKDISKQWLTKVIMDKIGIE